MYGVTSGGQWTRVFLIALTWYIGCAKRMSCAMFGASWLLQLHGVSQTNRQTRGRREWKRKLNEFRWRTGRSDGRANGENIGNRGSWKGEKEPKYWVFYCVSFAPLLPFRMISKELPFMRWWEVSHSLFCSCQIPSKSIEASWILTMLTCLNSTPPQNCIFPNIFGRRVGRVRFQI